MIFSSEVKAIAVRVPKLFDHPIGDLNCRLYPSVIERQLIKRKKAIGQIGVIIQIPIEARAAILVAVKESIAVPEFGEYKVRVPLCHIAVIVASEIRGSFSERPQHESIPIR